MTTETPGGGDARRGKATRAERSSRLTAIFVGVAVVSLAIVILSFSTDLFPDDFHSAAEFIGWRFAFLVLTVGLLAYVIERERSHRRILRRILDEHSRLVEVDRARSDIVASITHELKTPLTSLLGYARILRKRRLEAEQREECLDVIEQQGARILRLIEGLLQSSRLEAEFGKLQRAPLDLARLARDVASELATARNRAIEIDVPDGDLGLFGDAVAMEHVVTNLLDNAMKYSGDSAPVRVSIVDRDAYVHLTVRDEGVGIDASELQMIFDRFHQAGARDRGSAGLGLYIVRNLVEAQGGRVWAESELGKGTTFTVALPRRRR